MFEHATTLANERADTSPIEPVPPAEPRAPKEAPHEEPAAPFSTGRPTVTTRRKANGAEFHVAQVREIGGERIYLGCHDSHEIALSHCLHYIRTGAKPTGVTKHGRPKGARGVWSGMTKEERREYHRKKQAEYTQRSRDKRKGGVPVRRRAASVPLRSKAPSDSAEGVPTAARAEFLNPAARDDSGSGEEDRVIPPVLDVCCGSRMFWFDRTDARALFVDKRRETCVADTREGRRQIVVDPDILADFRALPFDDGQFTLVVFDPPHTYAGPNSWTRKKYGALEPDWREQIKAGFAECFRVLAPLGTLVFKWNAHRIPVSTILALTPEKPLFGQRCGTTARTHWIIFHKPEGPL